jgi:hypothetical protein
LPSDEKGRSITASGRAAVAAAAGAAASSGLEARARSMVEVAVDLLMLRGLKGCSRFVEI